MPRRSRPGPKPCKRRSSPSCSRWGLRLLHALRRWRPASAVLPEARDGGEEQILLDGNALAKPHAYFHIASVTHSPDHSLLAYAVDTNGSELYRVNVIEAAGGALVDSHINSPRSIAFVPSLCRNIPRELPHRPC